MSWARAPRRGVVLWVALGFFGAYALGSVAAGAQNAPSAQFPPAEPAPEAPAQKAPVAPEPAPAPPPPPYQAPVLPQQPPPAPGQYPAPYPPAPHPTPSAPHQPQQYPPQQYPPQQYPPQQTSLSPEVGAMPAPTRAPRPPPAPVLPPPPAGVCRDGQLSAYETDIDCGRVCLPCDIEKRCTHADDCVSGLCKAGVCRERLLEEGEPIPKGYHVEPAERDRASTARLAGIGFFSLSYAGAYVGALSSPTTLSWLYVPLIGPWVLIDDAERFAPEGRVGMTKVLLAADGALQVAGALMWLGGTLGRGQQLLRDPPQVQARDRPRVWLTPGVEPHGYGLRVHALF